MSNYGPIILLNFSNYFKFIRNGHLYTLLHSTAIQGQTYSIYFDVRNAFDNNLHSFIL
jgi:hypothetical protein